MLLQCILFLMNVFQSFLWYTNISSTYVSSVLLQDLSRCLFI